MSTKLPMGVMKCLMKKRNTQPLGMPFLLGEMQVTIIFDRFLENVL